MKKLTTLALTMMLFGLGANAQDADRKEQIKRTTDRLREPLKITDDDEWAIVSERLAAIVALRLERGGGRGGNLGPGRGGRGGTGGRPGGREGVQQGRGDGADQPQGRRGRRGRGGEQGRDGGDRDRERSGAENRDGNERDGQRGQRGPGGRDRGGPQGPNFDPDSTRGKIQAAIEGGASSNELKRLLTTLRSEREAYDRKMESAQAALREVVTTRQETILVMARYLD